ncbi:peptide-methionine (R)-S-oxide reductase MsrB [Metabacillus sp. GX 13764]|uniref:peptide-methionine (R)-S-oxide reductase MsrB n=1 Tax=Metabacillus kandeliae TaxID=2900151 RepID=UPI001E52FB97|nr:peptide-methionine (R)-S-oxide reductase MsrB [Metabacillus kandeliae]MCD7032650.1 peptide-methionine (R)-S-oxide reductase MsrB [Metabacillus kandeliae]
MKWLIGLLAAAVIIFLAVWVPQLPQYFTKRSYATEETPKVERTAAKASAIFAGGCFWCMEPPFEKLDGVEEVISGYTGGKKKNPSYEEVSAGTTGHVEAVQVIYDPRKVSYDDLLEVFWRQVDPTDPDGQFVDRGSQYESAIFYGDESEKKKAAASKEKLEKSHRFQKPIVTEIREAMPFYKAEDYHQDYYKKSKLQYEFYRKNSGRDAFLEKAWGKDRVFHPKQKTVFMKPSKAELKKILSPEQYKVTQENGTERPYKNEYAEEYADGIYVDIVSGEPLFSSKDKFDSGTGWPSFTKPLAAENIKEKEDRGLFGSRTEVRSKLADSHLGHVFNDGPKPTGKRYCMNSAALKFIPAKDLDSEGYGEYTKLFQ